MIKIILILIFSISVAYSEIVILNENGGLDSSDSNSQTTIQPTQIEKPLTEAGSPTEISGPAETNTDSWLEESVIIQDSPAPQKTISSEPSSPRTYDLLEQQQRGVTPLNTPKTVSKKSAPIKQESLRPISSETQPHTSNDLNGVPGIIGFSFAIKNGYPVISQIYASSPADNKKLQVGDIITEIDGKKTFGYTKTQIERRLAGDAGTTVLFKILTAGHTIEKTIVRSTKENTRLSHAASSGRDTKKNIQIYGSAAYGHILLTKITDSEHQSNSEFNNTFYQEIDLGLNLRLNKFFRGNTYGFVTAGGRYLTLNKKNHLSSDPYNIFALYGGFRPSISLTNSINVTSSVKLEIGGAFNNEKSGVYVGIPFTVGVEALFNGIFVAGGVGANFATSAIDAPEALADTSNAHVAYKSQPLAADFEDLFDSDDDDTESNSSSDPEEEPRYEIGQKRYSYYGEIGTKISTLLISVGHKGVYSDNTHSVSIDNENIDGYTSYSKSSSNTFYIKVIKDFKF